MLEIEYKKFGYKIKQFWFCDAPFDISGYDRVMFNSCTFDVDINGFLKETQTTLIIDLTQNLDIICKKMDNKSCRRRINKAIKMGISTKINQNYHDFINLNNQFRKMKGLPPYNIPIDIMKKHGLLLICELNGEIINGRFYFMDEDYIRQVLSASKRLDVSREDAIFIGCANRLSIWEAIKYAKKIGVKEYDMGGYYTGNIPDPQKERINIFKKSFGGEIAIRYNYQKDYSLLFSFGKKLKRYLEQSE